MAEMRRMANLALVLISFSVAANGQEPSVCYGTTSNGRLENGWKLPGRGSNFSVYSTIGRMLGRTYVHSVAHAILLDAYAELNRSLPDTVFVYGETGRKNGGQFDPHKTHQNGLSIDFMVPVVDEHDRSVPLPTSILNTWGYALDFDAVGRLDELRIDVEAMGEHLYQLHRSAEKHGITIWRVIFDPALQPLLHKSVRWPYLRDNLQFSTKPSWVRHDEHYHVDFKVPCEPAR